LINFWLSSRIPIATGEVNREALIDSPGDRSWPNWAIFLHY